jgi:TPR repeat protein
MRTWVFLIAAAFAAPADPEVSRALDAARARAAAGDVVAQFSLGAMLYYGGDDTAQAIEWIRKAAAQRYAPAEFHLGQIYDFGFGAAQNDRQALDWYRQAAEHGSAAAQRSPRRLLPEGTRRGRRRGRGRTVVQAGRRWG